MEIYREFKFDAAHKLPNLPGDHRCGNLHGHTFRVFIHIEGTVGTETGWVRDYGEIKSICAPLIDMLDHRYLNEIAGLENPTSENIALWLWEKIIPSLPELTMIEIKETDSTGCRFSG